MGYLPAEARIARHIEKLLTYGTPVKVENVLERCGLYRNGTAVHSRSGSVDDDTCYAYKQAVKSIFGETAYSFAKVNFVLSGCNCRDCSR